MLGFLKNDILKILDATQDERDKQSTDVMFQVYINQPIPKIMQFD